MPKKLDTAIEEYSSGKLSLGKAVELAESNYWSFLESLNEQNIPLNIDYEDVVKEIDRIQSGKFKKYLKK